MSEATFKLAYDGDALRDHEMDVSDLAPALLGLGELLKAAGRIVDGEGTDVRVRVRSTEPGCFQVWLSLIVDNASALKGLLETGDGQLAFNLLSVLGVTVGGPIGAVQLIKKLKGKAPTNVTQLPTGMVSLEIDGTKIEVPEPVARVTFNSSVRVAIEKVIAEPLSRDGIESVSLGTSASVEKIEKSEGEYFRAPPLAESDEFVSKYRKMFSIVTLSFKQGQKWKLNDGQGAPKSVIMSDAEFAARVDRSEVSFSKGDLLICDVVERSRRTAAGFKSEYEIVKVVEHRPPLLQPTFPLDPNAKP